MNMFFGGDDMGEIHARLLIRDVDAIWNRLTTIATSDAFDGDPRPLDSRRAEVLTVPLLDSDDPGFDELGFGLDDLALDLEEGDVLAECRRLGVAYPQASFGRSRVAMIGPGRRPRHRRSRRRRPS